MTIIQSIPTMFKLDILRAVHDFTPGTGDIFKMALYTSAAALNAQTTAYTAAGEITGTGYVAGGNVVPSVAPVIVGSGVVVDFSDVSWPAATFTTRGAMIYNSTSSNRAVMILDFGSDRSVTAQTFTVRFPEPTTNFAIIRVV